MKKIIPFCLLLLLSACHHDNEPVVKTVKPMSALVNAKYVSIYKFTGSYNGASMGYEFKALANGYVTGLGCAIPIMGSFTLTLYKVDTINQIGTQLANVPVAMAAKDTAGFNFKYVTLSSKVAIAKNNYYRVAMNGSFTAYSYMTIPTDSTYTLPMPLPTNHKFLFTKGVTGYANSYPDTDYTNYLFPADVAVEFP